ncbi:hypothetical protein MHB44_00635 [Lysinibacillus sp. FSL H8-0500]|uniref:hypothetical protein n=1 Tax=Lysinibacillus sp. FSL H8-0500 TaxID=2921393 RepID=UPI003101A865
MIFTFMLKNVFKAQTEAEILKSSVIYGWSLVGIMTITIALLGILPQFVQGGFDAGPALFVFLIAWILFTARYTSFKPMLGAASAGITIVAFSALLENAFARRNNGSFTMGILFGVLFVLLTIALKNSLVSLFYLIKETVRFIKYKKHQITLEDTMLQA